MEVRDWVNASLAVATFALAMVALWHVIVATRSAKASERVALANEEMTRAFVRPYLEFSRHDDPQRGFCLYAANRTQWPCEIIAVSLPDQGASLQRWYVPAGKTWDYPLPKGFALGSEAARRGFTGNVYVRDVMGHTYRADFRYDPEKQEFYNTGLVYRGLDYLPT